MAAPSGVGFEEVVARWAIRREKGDAAVAEYAARYDLSNALVEFDEHEARSWSEWTHENAVAWCEVWPTGSKAGEHIVVDLQEMGFGQAVQEIVAEAQRLASDA